jgi:hypothetical protein
VFLFARQEPLVFGHGLGLAVAFAKVCHALQVLCLKVALLRLGFEFDLELCKRKGSDQPHQVDSG